MSERQPKQIPENMHELRAWHVFKSLTGREISREQIIPGKPIPFDADYFTQTYIELDPESQQLQAVQRIRRRGDVVSVRPIKKSLEKFNLFGRAPREEIIIEKQ